MYQLSIVKTNFYFSNLYFFLGIRTKAFPNLLYFSDKIYSFFNYFTTFQVHLYSYWMKFITQIVFPKSVSFCFAPIKVLHLFFSSISIAFELNSYMKPFQPHFLGSFNLTNCFSQIIFHYFLASCPSLQFLNQSRSP